MAVDSITTRERILNEAAGIIQTRGFRGMSISDLLEAADIGKGSLYFYFKSKHELGFAVLERARENFMDFLRESLAGETPKERLFNFFDCALAEHKKMKFVGGCFWGNTALEVSDCDDCYAEFVGQVFEEWVEMIYAEISAGQKAGLFRCDIPGRTFARHIVSSIEGGIMQSRLLKDEKPLKEGFEALKIILMPAGVVARSRRVRR